MRRTTENCNSGEPGGELASGGADVTISGIERGARAAQVSKETRFTDLVRASVSELAVTTDTLHGSTGPFEGFSLWQGGRFAAPAFSTVPWHGTPAHRATHTELAVRTATTRIAMEKDKALTSLFLRVLAEVPHRNRCFPGSGTRLPDYDPSICPLDARAVLSLLAQCESFLRLSVKSHQPHAPQQLAEKRS
jgi:hypothetical protein